MSDAHVPRRVSLTEDMIRTLSREEIVSNLRQLNQYVSYLESKSSPKCQSDDQMTDSDDKTRHHRSSRLGKDDPEHTTQEQKQAAATAAQLPSVSQLRTTLLDPAVNLLFQKMKKQIDEKQERVEQAQNELSAWQFTPDSQTGKKLMSKCRTLIQENQELGRQLSQGRTAQLEAELALQRKHREQLQCSQNEVSDVTVQLDEEMQALQSVVITLQKQLQDTLTQLSRSQGETVQLQALLHTYQQTAQTIQSPPRTPDGHRNDDADTPGLVGDGANTPPSAAVDVDMETAETHRHSSHRAVPELAQSDNTTVRTRSPTVRTVSPTAGTGSAMVTGACARQRTALSRVLIDNYESEGSMPASPSQTTSRTTDSPPQTVHRTNSPPQSLLTDSPFQTVLRTNSPPHTVLRINSSPESVLRTHSPPLSDRGPPGSGSPLQTRLRTNSPPQTVLRTGSPPQIDRGPQSPVGNNGDWNEVTEAMDTSEATKTTILPNGVSSSQREDHHHGDDRTTNRKPDPLSTSSKSAPVHLDDPPASPPNGDDASSRTTVPLATGGINKIGETQATPPHITLTRTNNGLCNGLQGDITDSSDELMSD